MIADAKQVAPNKPFFMYFCTGAHARAAPRAEGVGRQVQGQVRRRLGRLSRAGVRRSRRSSGIIPKNTTLSRHDPDVQDWDKLPADERRLYARMMEVFAGFLEHTDHYIGELIAFLKEIGEYENTLIMVISDNGASAEGGPNGSVNEGKFFNNVPDDLRAEPGRHRRHRRAEVLQPLSVGLDPRRQHAVPALEARDLSRRRVGSRSSSAGPRASRRRGEVRTQYCHAIDMVPTVLDALGIEPPAQIRGVTQSPMEGFSLKSSFDDAKAPDLHITQYFEMFGHRSLYHDGWRAVCPWPGTSFTESGLPFGAPIDYDKLIELDAKGWELYNLKEDFAETNNLADKERDRLIAMIGMWYVEAGKYNVLPIDSRGTLRFAEPAAADRGRPQEVRLLSRHADGADRMPRRAWSTCRIRCRCTPTCPRAAPKACCSPWAATTAASRSTSRTASSPTATTTSPTSASRCSPNSAGFPKATTSSASSSRRRASPTSPRARACRRTSSCSSTARQIGSGDLPVTIPLSLGLAAGVSVGADAGSPVMTDYTPPFAFTGTVKKVLVDVIRRGDRGQGSADADVSRPPVKTAASIRIRYRTIS